MMLKVALTGGIATGKSYVLERLKARGIPTVEADHIVHEAFGPGTPTTTAIADNFGSVFLKPDGSIDRRMLATKVFRDTEARRHVEAIVHPIVYQKIQTWFQTLQHAFGVASIPLLYETGREHDFDFVMVTVCRPDVQLERLMQRDRMSEEEARQRIAAQMSAEEKAARGNFVIRTDDSKVDTDRQVDEVVAKLTKGS